MAPMTLTRDDALALSRAIGVRVSVVTGDGVAIVGTVGNVDTAGNLELTDATDLSGMAPVPMTIPMTSVLSWSPVKPSSKKGAHL